MTEEKRDPIKKPRPLPKPKKKIKYRYQNKREREGIYWKENGRLNIIIDGYIWSKDPHDGYWRSGRDKLHHYIYRKYKGEFKGNVGFKDGDKDNWDISNLYDTFYESYVCDYDYVTQAKRRTWRQRRRAQVKKRKLSIMRLKRARERWEAKKDMEAKELADRFVALMRNKILKK